MTEYLMEVPKAPQKVKKITFNCPLEIYKRIKEERESGKYNSYTDAVLTALRAKFL